MAGSAVIRTRLRSRTSGSVKTAISQTEVIRLVLTALKGLPNSKRKRWKGVVSADTRLYGPGSEIDSLGLVQLLVDVEERVSDHYGVAISLTDERALSQDRSPFQSVNRLAQYIVRLLTGEHASGV